MKGILILIGASFRSGGQFSTIRGNDDSYMNQMKASKSHIQFIEKLQEKKCDMHVYISSYTTKFDDDLKNMYSDYLIKSDFYDDLIGIDTLIHNSIKNIEDLNIYDFVLFVRIDLYLKQKFMDIFNLEWNTIRFPSICFKPHHKVDIHPRVNDMMLFIPKKYFNYIQFICNYLLNQWSYFIQYTDLTYNYLVDTNYYILFYSIYKNKLS